MPFLLVLICNTRLLIYVCIYQNIEQPETGFKISEIIGTKYLLLSKISIIFIEILYFLHERKFQSQ